MKAIDNFLDNINQIYLNSIYKVELKFKRKLTKEELELVADNFILRMTNHLKSKAKTRDNKSINLSQYCLENII